FLHKPFFGYGANNYSEEIEPIIGVAVYSHNNFIEMLVNVGFVGFCIFYFRWFHVLLLDFLKTQR
ncbi:MAG: O-antigen ligase family protein, partial [Bacteroidales bacterium]|nr:O-antigen ligase family protein [Bacteroidales bacterium]